LSQATKIRWLSIITNRKSGNDTIVYQNLFGKFRGHLAATVRTAAYTYIYTSIFKLLLAAS
jgi:hypothetical protein